MTAIIDRVRGLSRASKTLLVGIAILGLIASTGVLRAGRDVSISSEQAIELAETELDFEPERTAVKLVREGIDLQPVWAVSFSIPGTGGQEFEELLVVEINATDGEIIRLSRN